MLRLVVIASLFAFLAVEAAYYSCVPCFGPECDIKPQGCRFGEVKDRCGRTVCAKGPDESCGGPGNYFGKCGEGMSCSKCGRCSGCSRQRLSEGDQKSSCSVMSHICF